MKVNKTVRLAFLVTFALWLLPGIAAGSVNNEIGILITNAKIVTVDDDNPNADTLLIKNDRIVFVGDSGSAPNIPNLNVIDAGGRVVIPGIIDQHLHWMRSAITWGHHLHAGENAFTKQELLDALEKRADELRNTGAEWITLIGRHNHLQFLNDPEDPNSGGYPTRKELDRTAPGYKVMFLQRFTPTPIGTGPNDFNRAVFTGQGQLDTNARNFFRQIFGNDVIPKNGELDNDSNTLLYEFTRANNPLEEQVRSTIDLARWSHSVGLVGVGDPGGGGFREVQDYEPIMEADRRGQLNIRVRYHLSPRDAPGSPDQSRLQRLSNVMGAAPLAETQVCEGPAEISPGQGFHMSRVGGPFFKNQGLGEFITFPIPAENFRDASIFVLRRPDWSVHQHAEANQIEPAITGLELANEFDDPCRIGTIAERHWSFEHLNDATQDHFNRMAALGVMAGIQAVRFLFPDWQFSGPPYRSAVDTPGLVAGFGADGMFAGHGNPWTTMQFQVTGETYNGTQILQNDPRGDQRITIMEALRGHTRDAAWFTREENERGQLKAGYLADVVILNQDPFVVDSHEIRETKSVLTIVGGKIVHEDL